MLGMFKYLFSWWLR